MKLTTAHSLIWILSLLIMDCFCITNLKKQSLEGECSGLSSCARSTTTLSTDNCHCDSLCRVYDDCCWDYAGGGTDERIPRPSPLDRATFSCENLPTCVDCPDWIYVVNKCPSDFDEAYVKGMCEENDQELAIIPVTDVANDIVYRNYYCAECHRAAAPLFWKIGYSSVKKTNVSDAGHFLDIAKDEMRFIPPVTPRDCKRYLRKCLAGWANSAQVDHCERTGRATFVFAMGKTYYNEDCARCNSVTNYDCTIKSVFKSRGDARPSLRNDASFADEWQPIPFSIVFDPNAASWTEASKARVIKREECPSGSLFNPFKVKCQELVCANGYRLSERGCVAAETSKNTSQHLENRVYSFVLGETGCSDDELISLNDVSYNNATHLITTNERLYSKEKLIYYNDTFLMCSRNGSEYFPAIFPHPNDDVQAIISTVGIVISLVALILMFAVYMVFPTLRNLPGKYIVSLITALFFAQLLFLFVNPVDDFFERNVCFVFSVVMHFSFLAAFFWMNAIAFDICNTFRALNKHRSSADRSVKRFVAYSLYCWGSSLTIVGVAVVIDSAYGEFYLAPKYAYKLCWINNGDALLAFFVLPVAVILFTNVVFFILTVVYIYGATKAARAATDSSEDVSMFILYLKLAVVMGFTWIIGFLAVLTKSSTCWFLFIVVNSLQGFFICLAFVCTKKVFRLITAKFGRPKASTTSGQILPFTNTTNVSK